MRTLLIATMSLVAVTAVAQRAPECKPAGPLIRIPQLSEASGVAVSRRTTGRLWAHNDSGQPMLIALDTRGAVTGRVRLNGVKLDNWEAIAVGSCREGSCLYIGDIGDNAARRKHVSVYRVAEPSTEDAITLGEAFHATYPDGAHDAEALLVGPDGTLFVVTKGETDEVGLYRFPKELRNGATHQLERVGQAKGSTKASPTDRITDGSVSADGAWVVLRTRQSLTFYRGADLLSGTWREAGRVDLKAIGEAQGEGVAMAADGSVYLTGESGGKSLGGTFAKLTCSTPETR